MSKNKPPKKKVVVTTSKKEASSGKQDNKAVAKKKASVSRRKTKPANQPVLDSEMIFTRKNYMFMGIGLGLIILGLVLMSGGSLPPDQWDPNVIYSFRRTVLAPIVILAGLGVEIYAIFKR